MATEKRLIDANFLDDRCRRQIADEWNQKVAPVSWSEAYKEFLDDVCDAPILDAVEVVHARNLRADSPSLFECSECGWSDCDTYTGDTAEYNYCPNCGAKMDLKGE
jgi:uncharacterized ferredoxin-like protein